MSRNSDEEREARHDAGYKRRSAPDGEATGAKPIPFVKARQPLEAIYRVSLRAGRPADDILAAARVSMDDVEKVIRKLDGKPCRGFALLYASQKASPLVASDPKRALELAQTIFEEAESLMDANLESRTATPAPRQNIQAEAKLLESQAQLQLGFARQSRDAVNRARTLYRECGDIGFGRALCDYYEGSAASFAKDYAAGEKLLNRALRSFAEFGQDHLVARAEAALGSLFVQRGDNLRALQYLERATETLQPERDSRHLAAALNNRADTLARLNRFDEARATYARAMNLARKHGYRSLLRHVRSGLAELDFRRGRYQRALRAFNEISRESEGAGVMIDALFARLYVAECLGRLAQESAMVLEVETLRQTQKANVFAPTPAMEELFRCLDQGLIDADLVAHVRSYLQDLEAGTNRAYRPLRLVG